MNYKITLTALLAVFCIFCASLALNAAPHQNSGIILAQTTAIPYDQAEPAPQNTQLQAAEPARTLRAENNQHKIIAIGSVDEKSGFKFRLELDSKAAAIRKATFSEYDDRDYKNPQPFDILKPVPGPGGTEFLSLANKELVFVKDGLQLPLQKLNWKTGDIQKTEGGSETISFEALITDAVTTQPIIKLIKTYKVTPESYLLDCKLTVENLSPLQQQVRFNIAGAAGIGREALRTDMRRAIAGYRDTQGQITSVSLDTRKLSKAKTVEQTELAKPGAGLLWAAITNKYFAAILVPVPTPDKDYCDWITQKRASYYNPDADRRNDAGDETIGLDLAIQTVTLAPTGVSSSSKNYDFKLYLGPKDKRLFDKNDYFSRLGFVHTITFMPCFCCPTAIIYPLAFGILALMEWGHSFIGNYGIVIIILVFLVRLILHPLTKKSQVSMSKMSKLAPMAEQIKKKYAKNKAEMNKQLMALYREQGASPIMGMLPMFVQMPIWIALYSAIYASISLRGAAFLPFWITDLSAPDALFRFTAVTLPIFGKLDSFNLLPILMGVAFYLQQKMMPSQSAASTNPQVAQQQKMMMIMMPILFPLMLYKAPSGLNLYIMSSVFAGVVEQYVIRKHIREKEQAEAQGLVPTTSKTGGKVKKKKPKPFFKI